MYRIIRRKEFSDTTFLWDVLAPDVAKAAQPGHFVMLRLHEGGERIPLTVADFDRDQGTITMVIQAMGKTTREMRDRYREGDSFDDFVGPLGMPQHVAHVGTRWFWSAVGSALHRYIHSSAPSSRQATAPSASSASAARIWCSGKSGSGNTATN
jgi:NAD(P)H-flavin reductase